jgi:hypothetical protein
LSGQSSRLDASMVPCGWTSIWRIRRPVLSCSASYSSTPTEVAAEVNALLADDDGVEAARAPYLQGRRLWPGPGPSRPYAGCTSGRVVR